MGVLLIGMLAAPQVMFSNNIGLNDDASLSDVPDEIHNYFMEEFDDGFWVDAKSNGVNLNLSGYSVYDTVNLQFNFSFYNVYEFDTFYVSGYGYIDFFDSMPTNSYRDVPAIGFVGILPYLEYMGASDNVYLWNTPEFCAIEYNNFTNYGGSGLGSFEVVLYSNGTINFNYKEILNVESPTIGLNFGDGEYYNEYPGESLEGVTDFTLQFNYIAAGPELAVVIDGPSYIWNGTEHMYTAMAINLGSTNETNLEFSFFLNDVLVNSITIFALGPLHNSTLTYNFTGTEEGLAVLRATIEEVPSEFTYENNEVVFSIIISLEQEYAIFQDREPWGTTAIQDILDMHGIPYDILGSQVMGLVNLTNYTRVIISSSQPVVFRERVYDNLTWFEDYAANGGILEVHAADQSSEQWIDGLLPGRVNYTYDTSEYLEIVQPTHQIMNVPSVYSADDLGDWNSATHGYLADLHPASQVILNTIAGYPVLIEFPFDDGHIIITTQTVEWGYEERNVHFLENLLLYSPLHMDHDVAVTLEAPYLGVPDDETVMDLGVSNWGTSAESNVVVTIHANDELIYSHTVTTLAVGEIYTDEVQWTPQFPGTYELTAYVEPVSGEDSLVNNEMTRSIVISSPRGIILWDEGHGCHDREFYDDWILNLAALGYQVDGTTDRFNASLLSDYSALICAEPEIDYWSNETDAIQNFVSNGGGFFVIGDSYQASLNNLTLFAGIEWLSAGEWGGVTDNITAHAVTAGVEEVYFDSPVSYLNLTGSAEAHVFLDSLPAVAVVEVGAGRMVAIADDNCLDADEGDNLNEADNLRLGNNIINWITEGRTYNIITNVAHVPSVVNSTHLVNVTCDVEDFQGVVSVTLFYRVNGSDWVSVEMELVSGTTYQGTIPAQSAASVVEYYVSATNTLGHTTIDYNDGDFYGYTVTTPTTPPPTTTTTNGGGLPDTTMLIIIIAGAGGVVLVIVIIYLYKKKSV